MKSKSVRFGKSLQLTQLEDWLTGRIPYREGPGWAKNAGAKPIALDFSEVEYADFGALARLAAICEGAMRHGFAVNVELPNLNHAEPITVSRRRRCLEFMYRSGFVSCLFPLHVPNVSQLMRVTSSGEHLEVLGVQDESDSHTASRGPKDQITVYSPNIIPLNWISNWEQRTRELWELEIFRLLRLKGPHLSEMDARIIVQIVLRELLRNVEDHAAELTGASTPPGSLAGAYLARDHIWDSFLGGSPLSFSYQKWLVEERVPAVRLVVADSGVGLPATLDLSLAPRDELALWSDERLSLVERVIHWSLSPWSSRRPPRHDPPRSVRGLASIRRVVRETYGSLMIRTSHCQVAISYPSGRREATSTADLASAPGTFIDLCLTGALRNDLEERSSGAAVPEINLSGVSSLEIGAGARIDLAKALATIREGLLATAGQADVFHVLVADFPNEAEARIQFALDIIHLGEELAEQARLILYCRTHEGPQLASLLGEIDDIRIAAGEIAQLPVLVIDTEGHPHFVGLDAGLHGRLLRTMAARAAGPLPEAEIAQTLGVSAESLNEAVRSLSHYVERTTQGLRLFPTPLALHGALFKALETAISARLPQSEASAPKGKVLVTEMLTAVRGWIHVPDLLAAPFEARLTGFLLGYQLRLGTADLMRERARVVVVGAVEEPLIEGFMRAINATPGVVRFSGEVGVYDDPSLSFVSAGTRVVLLTDLISSAGHLRHAMTDLIRAGVEPIAVGTIIDARAEKGEIRVLGQPIPLFSVSRRTLVVEEPVNCSRDKSSLEFHHQGHLRLDQSIWRELIDADQARFTDAQTLDWCNDQIVLTGHIVRQYRRHYQTFLDMRALIAKEAHRKQLCDKAVERIRQFVADLPKAPKAIVIMHAGSAEDPAGVLASHIAQAAQRSRGLPSISTIPVYRFLRGGRWLLHPTMRAALPEESCVVAFDWGAVTLHTSNQLVGAAVSLGAVGILSLSATSQLNWVEEASALRVRTVAGAPAEKQLALFPESRQGRAVSDEHSGRKSQIPVQFSFLASFHVAYENATDCSLCNLAQDYSTLAKKAPTAFLRDHATVWAKRLEPRELNEARIAGPEDLAGSPLSTSEVRLLIELQRQIERAAESLSSRYDLLKRLEDGSGDANLCTAFVRLITLEPALTKRAPLRFRAFRDALANLIVLAIQSDFFTKLPESVRVLYCISLRVVSKPAFLAHAPDLLCSALKLGGDDNQQAGVVLWGLYSLISRAYHQGSDAAREIGKAIGHAYDMTSNDPAISRTKYTLSAISSLSLLLSQVDYCENLARSGTNLSAQDAWQRLRHDFLFPVSDHNPDVRMSNVYAALTNKRPRTTEDWSATLRDWRTTQVFLVRYVLPLLPSVRDIVVARLYERKKDEIARWGRLCSIDDVMRDFGQVQDLLNSFVENPDVVPLKREESIRLVGWWYPMIFERRGTESLLYFLDKCPCYLETRVRNAAKECFDAKPDSPFSARNVVWIGTAPEQVFCDEDVVSRTFDQLFSNIVAPERAVPGQPITVEVEFQSSDSHTIVVIRNTGTSRITLGGHGITYFDRALRNYDGFVREVVTQARDRWTFAVAAGFKRWESRNGDLG